MGGLIIEIDLNKGECAWDISCIAMQIKMTIQYYR